METYGLTIGIITLASALGGAVFCLITYQLLKIYQENFLNEVDRGLQDILLYMNPNQLLYALALLLILFFPISIYLFKLPITIFLSAIILFSPRIVLPILRKRRQKKIIEQLPDTLISMATAMRSGLNLVQALQQVVKNQSPPISQEFAQVLLEYRVGQDLVDSLEALHTRVPREELVLVSSAIKIARQVGGNLSETLDSLADTLREKLKIEGRINALTAMGKAQGLLAVLFPIVMGYLFYKLEPVAITRLFITVGGLIWLSIMIVMVILAAILIRKVVDIDV